MLNLRLLPGLLLATACLAACAPWQGQTATTTTGDGDSLVVFFTGDLLLDRGVRTAMASHPADWLLADVAPVLRRADATVANLECPLTQVSTPVGKRYIFRADTCMASMMRRAGITHANLANNHTNDQGEQGLRSTMHSLTRAGVVPIGCDTVSDDTARLIHPSIVSKGDLRLALFPAVLLSQENWMPRPGALSPLQPSLRQLERSVREHARRHPTHRIACILHWGVEFQTQPTMQQMAQAAILAGAGADAIIGHHPHVVQHPRRSDPIPTFYSLGGFAFDQSHPLARRGAVARIVVHPDTLTATLIPISINACRPEWDRQHDL